MEKFLEHHQLTQEEYNTRDLFRIVVKDQSNILIDELVCYCILDVMEITRFYLEPDGRFWYTVKVTKC